jgi:hypothetical protein
LKTVDPEQLNKTQLMDNLFEHYLDDRVVDDKILCKVIILTIVSSLSSNPINLFIKGETSTGKTFTVKNIVNLFKNENCSIRDNIIAIGKISPTAIYYQEGTLYDLKQNREVEKVKVGKDSYVFYKDEAHGSDPDNSINTDEVEISKVIDMRGKTLIFYEAPSYETMMMIRSLLSHDNDKQDLEYKITKDQEVMTIYIRGSPASIFCQAQVSASKENPMEEIHSRVITVSPNENKSKYKKVINKLGIKYSFEKIHNEEDRINEELLMRVLTNEINSKVINVLESGRDNQWDKPMGQAGLMQSVYSNVPLGYKLSDRLPYNQGSDMRHADQYMQLLKLHTLFNSTHRPVIAKGSLKVVLSNQDDYMFLLKIIELFGNSIRGGIPKSAVDLYEKIFQETHNGGITTDNLAKMVGQSPKKLLNNELRHLRTENWIESIRDEDDKRKKLWKSMTTDLKIKEEMMFINNNSLIEFGPDDVKEFWNGFKEANKGVLFDGNQKYQIGLNSETIDEDTLLKALECKPQIAEETRNYDKYRSQILSGTLNAEKLKSRLDDYSHKDNENKEVKE